MSIHTLCTDICFHNLMTYAALLEYTFKTASKEHTHHLISSEMQPPSPPNGLYRKQASAGHTGQGLNTPEDAHKNIFVNLAKCRNEEELERTGPRILHTGLLPPHYCPSPSPPLPSVRRTAAAQTCWRPSRCSSALPLAWSSHTQACRG
ncbi:hypothetical protein AOLI_G00083740 [Acnodon oligacanthus]